MVFYGNIIARSLGENRKLKIKVKGKVIPVLLTKHHAMKSYWGSECIAPLIL
jgi:hypothetical protein